ncbi:unnamed protein product, partial [Mesorhabditis belari]|uniref:Uncharacterized protein n=1 Tax=Mesorhabditis belari TaxID=2138241 RepID=A0AAF3FHV4_9BILA
MRMGHHLDSAEYAWLFPKQISTTGVPTSVPTPFPPIATAAALIPDNSLLFVALLLVVVLCVAVVGVLVHAHCRSPSLPYHPNEQWTTSCSTDIPLRSLVVLKY